MKILFRFPLRCAFTRIELLACLLGLALVIAVVFPALAGNRARSDRLICANNLRQIGLGMQLWGNDHDDLFPFEVPTAAGGTYQHVLGANVWLHLSWLSNQLTTPRIFLCPTDTGRPAQDFSGSSASGYVHQNFANRATSYALSHSYGDLPGDVIALDRNIRTDGLRSCSRFPYLVLRGLTSSGLPVIEWTDRLHGLEGNALALDGRVQQINTPRTLLMDVPSSDNGARHFILPR